MTREAPSGALTFSDGRAPTHAEDVRDPPREGILAARRAAVARLAAAVDRLHERERRRGVQPTESDGRAGMQG